MRKLLIAAGLLCSFAIFAQSSFKPLFNGKDLDGWSGDPRLWHVENGEIVGNTEGISLNDNSFLIYKGGEFRDFVLRAKMKLRNHNSGIQFRSEELPNWVVRGYQADAAEGNWWGSLYEEKGKRGTMVNGWKDKGERVLKANDWNEYEILCDGDHIQIKLNGLVTADVHDSASDHGIIALQLHRGPGMEVRFKDIEIRLLNSKPNGKSAD